MGCATCTIRYACHVFVPHQQKEALEVADRVVLMNHGKVEQLALREREEVLVRARNMRVFPYQQTA